MQMTKTKKYIDSFLGVLSEEDIPYKLLGRFKNHLSISRVESAPKEDE